TNCALAVVKHPAFPFICYFCMHRKLLSKTFISYPMSLKPSLMVWRSSRRADTCGTEGSAGASPYRPILSNFKTLSPNFTNRAATFGGQDRSCEYHAVVNSKKSHS